MAISTPKPKREINYKFVGAGIGILVVWAFVNFYPEKINKVTFDVFGPNTLGYMSFILFISSMFSFVAICSNIAENANFKRVNKIKAKYGNFEISMEKKENDEFDIERE